LNWAEERQPEACTIGLTLPPVSVSTGRSLVGLTLVRRLMGEIAMTNFNAGARASEGRQADEDLTYEVGTVHDYFSHRRHRARRGGQLVGIAILWVWGRWTAAGS
jgi:hypothetical protein